MAELYWGEKFQIYVTPVNAEEICVVLLSRNRQLRLDQTLPKFPELRARLSNAVSVGSERGGVTRSRLLWRVARHNAALIGDASGSVDAISGQGLGLSFQQAVVLADALEASDLAEYQRAHRRIFAKPFVSSFVLLSLTSNAWLREIVIRRLANNPRLFARLLAYHASSDEELKHNYARIAPKLAARVLNGSG
jgi:flavin-dependent dehydrogenase